ncbi:acetylornithine transaminase [Lactococcus allomyrinae]|uniref:Acetylornithine transaminase n=1 Tax=Lactococcus allomyrinae TaxID=2419773 RepID=A0A387BHB7_9LACT|nr:acetylornithine transaminase [Lactococcus allomyrinae]AYG00270.1 acetylornithine transaminase [Lactococcus allomyrinae]
MTDLLENYSRFPFSLIKGEEVYLFDENGKRYLDFTSGIGVMNMGYSFEAGKIAVKTQIDALSHLSNLYQNPLQEKVAAKLSQNHEYKAFFCNSGTEANEAALKLTRLIKSGQKVLAFNHGFHGRTFGAMSATMQEKIQAGFSPLLPDFVCSDYNDVDGLWQVLSNQNIGAIILEMVQGEGGVLPITPEFVQVLKEAQKAGILLIIDEVQTGIGRTGKLFSFEHFGLKPDIFTVAKALANGIPTGAMLCKNEYADYFSKGKHGSTFGGNPLAMASANEVLTAMTPDFLSEVTDKSEFFLSVLTEKLSVKSQVKAIRSVGLMLGIQLTDGQKITEILGMLRDEGLLALSAGDDVIRLLPPLIMTKAELVKGAEILEKVL